MMRWLCSALIGLALISSSPTLAADATKQDAVIAATEPAPIEPAPLAGANPSVETATGETRAAAAAVAPMTEPVAPPPLTLTVEIDLTEQRMYVSENGEQKYAWPISSGTAEFPTPRGTFRPQWTAKMWYSRKYDWAPMPHAVFINGGVAVHATYHTGALGSPASHGCIRLAPANAKTFYNLVHRHGLKSTRVAVNGTPKWRAPAMASRAQKRQPQFAANDGFWFWGSPSSSYSAASAYDPGFTKKRGKKLYGNPYANNLAPPKAYRQRGTNRIVYIQQKPNYYNNSW